MTVGRKNIMLGTAGHVDHGKTSLVKLLTGCDTDTLAEEQKRGLTIDIGFARCRMADENILGVIDVPGHVDFIRNMVAGAHGIDVVIFVVAADDGVMPQTREHLDILTLMGARGGIVALTKIDLVPPDLRERVAQDIRRLLAGTFLAQAPICPISNITGQGHQGLFDALNAAVACCPQRRTDGLFRMWVQDVYSIHGFGTVATGIPRSGMVRAGDFLTILPSLQRVKVRKLEVYGQDAPAGLAGQCVALNLADIDAGELGRGMAACEGPAFKSVTMVEAELHLLPHAARPLKDYAQVQLNIGTAEVAAHVALLEDSKFIEPGQSQMVQLRLARPLGLACGDRFVIRTDLGGVTAGHLNTVGGGRILSTSDIRLRRNRPWTLAALRERGGAIDDPPRFCETVLKESATPLSLADLATRMQARLAEVQAIVPALVSAGRAMLTPAGLVVHRHLVDELARRAMAELEKFHAANPQRLGIDQAELAKLLSADQAVFELAVGELTQAGAVQIQGGVLMQAGRQVTLDEEDRLLCQRIEQTLRSAGLCPPAPQELAGSLALGQAEADKLLRLLIDQGVLVRLDDKLVMHACAIEHARAVVLQLFAKAASFETAEYRDALGVSRKFALPLLDYFDTIRLTARSGNRRTPGAAAKKAMAGEQAR